MHYPLVHDCVVALLYSWIYSDTGSVVKPFLYSCGEMPVWGTHTFHLGLATLSPNHIVSEVIPAQKVSERFCFGTQCLVSMYCAPQTAVIKGSFTFTLA